MNIFKFLFVSLLMWSCQGEKHYEAPPGYNLNKPDIYKTHEALYEISGHAFYKGRSDTLYAQQDERGAVYTLVLGTDYMKRSLFKKHGDFEDMAILNETVLMLKSNGKLYSFPYKALRNTKINIYQRWKGLLPKGEYESLYANNETGKIYVLCKDCKRDRQTSLVSGYVFAFNDKKELKPAGEFQINSDQIAELTDQKSIVFKPSALAYNRWRNEWFILSSVNKMLVVADVNWRIKNVYPLNPSIYTQPEGMDFDNDRNLFISSEGSKLRMGRIFRINFQGD